MYSHRHDCLLACYSKTPDQSLDLVLLYPRGIRISCSATQALNSLSFGPHGDFVLSCREVLAEAEPKRTKVSLEMKDYLADFIVGIYKEAKLQRLYPWQVMTLSRLSLNSNPPTTQTPTRTHTHTIPLGYDHSWSGWHIS